MPLPRNSRAKNQNTHKKNAIQKENTKKTSEIDTICTKHKIGNLTFRSCKFATDTGAITFVEYDSIRGNLRNGVVIVKATLVTTATDIVYDVIEIEKAKKERDEKKKQDDAEKTRNEVERIVTSNSTSNKDETNENHQNLLEKMIDQDADQPDTTKDNVIATENSVIITENSVDGEKEKEDNVITTENSVDGEKEKDKEKEKEKEDQNKKNNSKTKFKKTQREKNAKKMQEQLEAKANAINGNKYFRNFMKDIKSKFILNEKAEFKYFEVKAEATDMIIENVKTYQIVMPNNVKEIYFLVIGDLQMKSALIRRIDPAYKADKIFQEQNDFLERIQAKENSKIMELSEELDDLEEDDLDEEKLNVKEELDVDSLPIPENK